MVDIIRNAAGAALLACAWVPVVYAYGAYGGQEWLAELFGNVISGCYLGMIPLSMLYGLLALPGGSGWERRLTRSMIMKLLLIPFFIVNFWMGLAGTMVFFLGGLLLTWLALLIAWLTLLATSVDVMKALVLMRRERRLTASRMVKHMIFQLIYCVDVVDASVLWLNRDTYVPET